MSWSENKEFFAVAREKWPRDLRKAIGVKEREGKFNMSVARDAGASQRMAYRFQGWVAAKVAAGADPQDLFAPDPD